MSDFIPILSPIKIGDGTEITNNSIKLGEIQVDGLNNQIKVGADVTITKQKIKIGTTSLTDSSIVTNKLTVNTEIETSTVIANNDFIIKQNDVQVSVKDTLNTHGTDIETNQTNITNNRATLSTHTARLNAMDTKIEQQNDDIAAIAERMSKLNFSGGYGIFGRVNNDDGQKNQLVGHIAAVGPLVYGFLYNGNNEILNAYAIDNLWTDLEYSDKEEDNLIKGPQTPIYINWYGKNNKVRVFEIYHYNDGSIKFTFKEERSYTKTVPQNNTFFWYERKDREINVNPDTSYDYHSVTNVTISPDLWEHSSGYPNLYICTTQISIEKSTYIDIPEFTRKVVCISDVYEMSPNELEGLPSAQDIIFYACQINEKEGTATIDMLISRSNALPPEEFNLQTTIDAKGYN